MKDKPYRPGNDDRIIMLLVLLLSLMISGTAGAQHPLEPVDTSSPRATMKSFLAVTEEASRRYNAYRDSPSAATMNALFQMHPKFRRLLDLSEVPPAAREEESVETFRLLWAIIARLSLPELSDIPDAAVDEEGEALSHWRIPNTDITIARIDEGPRAGEYLFSSDTVEQAKSFHALVKQLPYQRPVPLGDLSRMQQQLTGWMIPMAWVEVFPGWANTLILGQVLWKWFAVLVLFGLAIVAVIAAFRWRRGMRGNSSLKSYLRHISPPLVVLILEPLLDYLIAVQINTSGVAAEAPFYLLGVARGLALIWLIWATVNWIAHAITASPRIKAGSLDASLVYLAARSLGIVVIAVLLFRMAYDVGIPVYGLVAGAGVGGVAIALAARSTLENFLGTLNIFADRPVRVGDFCRYGEDPSAAWQRTGVVEEIGLRSTRIRGLDRTLTTIPNADFANMHIVNLAERDRMLFRPTLMLRYETTFDQLRLLLVRLRELLLAHPRVTDDPARVRFAGFGAYSLNVEIFAYVNTSDWNEFLAIQEDIDLRILKIVEEVGTGFAVPARVYLARDGGIDAERQQAAAKQAREWAASQTLPFPDFSDEYRKQIMDTLDYPPQGSPDADGQKIT
jgi:MscS family membrane protein